MTTPPAWALPEIAATGPACPTNRALYAQLLAADLNSEYLDEWEGGPGDELAYDILCDPRALVFLRRADRETIQRFGRYLIPSLRAVHLEMRL